MKGRKYTKRLVLWISPGMQEKLDKISEKTSRGKSEIIREAISRLIVEYEAESGTRTPKEVKNG